MDEQGNNRDYSNHEENHSFQWRPIDPSEAAGGEINQETAGLSGGASSARGGQLNDQHQVTRRRISDGINQELYHDVPYPYNFPISSDYLLGENDMLASQLGCNTHNATVSSVHQEQQTFPPTHQNHSQNQPSFGLSEPFYNAQPTNYLDPETIVPSNTNQSKGPMESLMETALQHRDLSALYHQQQTRENNWTRPIRMKSQRSVPVPYPPHYYPDLQNQFLAEKSQKPPADNIQNPSQRRLTYQTRPESNRPKKSKKSIPSSHKHVLPQIPTRDNSKKIQKVFGIRHRKYRNSLCEKVAYLLGAGDDTEIESSRTEDSMNPRYEGNVDEARSTAKDSMDQIAPRTVPNYSRSSSSSTATSNVTQRIHTTEAVVSQPQPGTESLLNQNQIQLKENATNSDKEEQTTEHTLERLLQKFRMSNVNLPELEPRTTFSLEKFRMAVEENSLSLLHTPLTSQQFEARAFEGSTRLCHSKQLQEQHHRPNNQHQESMVASSLSSTSSSNSTTFGTLDHSNQEEQNPQHDKSISTSPVAYPSISQRFLLMLQDTKKQKDVTSILPSGQVGLDENSIEQANENRDLCHSPKDKLRQIPPAKQAEGSNSPAQKRSVNLSTVAEGSSNGQAVPINLGLLGSLGSERRDIEIQSVTSSEKDKYKVLHIESGGNGRSQNESQLVLHYPQGSVPSFQPPNPVLGNGDREVQSQRKAGNIQYPVGLPVRPHSVANFDFSQDNSFHSGVNLREINDLSSAIAAHTAYNPHVGRTKKNVGTQMKFPNPWNHNEPSLSGPIRKSRAKAQQHPYMIPTGTDSSNRNEHIERSRSSLAAPLPSQNANAGHSQTEQSAFKRPVRSQSVIQGPEGPLRLDRNGNVVIKLTPKIQITHYHFHHNCEQHFYRNSRQNGGHQKQVHVNMPNCHNGHEMQSHAVQGQNQIHIDRNITNGIHEKEVEMQRNIQLAQRVHEHQQQGRVHEFVMDMEGQVRQRRPARNNEEDSDDDVQVLQVIQDGQPQQDLEFEDHDRME